MTDGQAGDADTTDASRDDETHLEAARSAVDTLLRDVRRVIGRSTATAAESQPLPVLIADGGQDDVKIIVIIRASRGKVPGGFINPCIILV